jgi:hypothetical protein
MHSLGKKSNLLSCFFSFIFQMLYRSFLMANRYEAVGNFDPFDCIVGKGGIWKFRIDILAIREIDKKCPSAAVCLVPM